MKLAEEKVVVALTVEMQLPHLTSQAVALSQLTAVTTTPTTTFSKVTKSFPPEMAKIISALTIQKTPTFKKYQPETAMTSSTSQVGGIPTAQLLMAATVMTLCS